MEDIISWMKTLSSGHHFYFIALVSVIPLFILMKKKRLSFLFPVMLVTILVLTPFFYKIINNTVDYYWRILWILPIIPLCAALPCAISEKIKETFVGGKVALIGLFAVAFIFLGSFAYGYHFGIFVKPTNTASKLPKEAVEVADYLLTLEENPHVVIAPEMKYDEFMDCWTVTGLQDYIRQYSGKIELLYGRVNYILDMSSAGRTVCDNLMYEGGDLSLVAQKMLDYGYSFLVVKENEDNRFDNLEKYGFEKLANVSGYFIYRVSGYASERRTYNELGQVIEVTYIDQYGNPRELSDGYSVIVYKYDWNGNVIKEFRCDKNGVGILNLNGNAGWEREYDYKSRCIVARQLGENGYPIVNDSGYYELRKQYGFRKVKNSYYDSSGNPVILDEGYSSVWYFYNKNNQCIREKYYNATGDLCISTNGYAEICREYDYRYLCICEKYFGIDGEPLEQEAGYYGKKMEYDDKKRISKIVYLDSNWDEKNRKDGFSSVCWVDNEITGSRDVVFVNENGEEVPIDGINLVNGVCYGTDGWSKWMTPFKNTVNNIINIGMVNLGSKKAGDIYTCYLTIEFSDVSATEGEPFLFWAQGSADDRWDIGNVWNPSLIRLDSEPEDGIYYLKYSAIVNEAMEHASEYGVGFRCDNWASGSFRVKDVMIIKGDNDKEWSAGL